MIKPREYTFSRTKRKSILFEMQNLGICSKSSVSLSCEIIAVRGVKAKSRDRSFSACSPRRVGSMIIMDTRSP